MIYNMNFKIIAVSNRSLCLDFLQQIEKIANSQINSIILREKDLLPVHYRDLALEVKALCEGRNIELIIHNHLDLALELGLPLHLSWALFEDISKKNVKMTNFGVSVHSIEEAGQAIENNAAWLIAGHIFPVKGKNTQARGTGFLSEICKMSEIPVYGIGGISSQNIREIAESGAKGACLMSSIMQSHEPENFVKMLLDNIF